MLSRQILKEALCRYVSNTAMYIDMVRSFLEILPEWTLAREIEMLLLVDIKDRLDKLYLTIKKITKSKTKGKALKYSVINFIKKDSKLAELEGELAAVLRDTPAGLEQLDGFLDAVEKLAVTSKHVFTRNQILHLSNDTHLDTIQAIITAAQDASPLLLEFKRDAKAFFQPKLPNLEVLSYQLDRYVKTTNMICEKLPRRLNGDFDRGISPETAVNLSPLLSEGKVWRMLEHINLLDEIRMDPNFRMVFLFPGELYQGFIEEFRERQPRMLEFLGQLEESAVQRDRMNKGSKISSVAGSSVGAVGGVLSIVGLALIPVTAGVSLALTMTGVGLGVTSGVNSLVTTATEMGVNHTQQKKANKVFQSFMKDVARIQDCLGEVSRQTVAKMETDGVKVAVGVSKILRNAGAVGKGIDSLVDVVSAAKLLGAEEAIAGAGKVLAQEGKALRNVPRVASEIPDVGQAVAKGPLALGKGARAGFIALNALFLGMDIFFICKDSISLARGSETEASQFIRARAALWSSEIDSWKKIHDCLDEGLKTSAKKEAVLETPFYPDADNQNVAFMRWL
ncbi:uncharacterized protein ACNS7B_009687 [Menidia menidia]